MHLAVIGRNRMAAVAQECLALEARLWRKHDLRQRDEWSRGTRTRAWTRMMTTCWIKYVPELESWLCIADLACMMCVRCAL